MIPERVPEAYEEFGWLGEHGLFYDVSCVSFARSLTSRGALTRLGAGAGELDHVDFEEFQRRTMECVDSDNMRSTYVGAVAAGGWTVLIQLWAGSIGLDRGLMRRLSQGTEVVSVSLTGFPFSRSLLDMRFLAAPIRPAQA
ncbi:DUF6461 domain-containing protein [Nonomuraea zeae]|uniref:DUF6461 domain-containing protein n=1 Tax=Nonomuraea zeae TaxID=1642303 RepID=UPI0014796217|nr:DUF6461 domain-containing protein [Nonomuraea zeae]